MSGMIIVDMLAQLEHIGFDYAEDGKASELPEQEERRTSYRKILAVSAVSPGKMNDSTRSGVLNVRLSLTSLSLNR